MNKPEPNDPFQVVVWVVIQTVAKICPYCSNNRGENHKPFCVFEKNHGFGLGTPGPCRSENMHQWLNGFYDGMNQFCRIEKKDDPHYLLGNEAGNKMYHLPAAAT
jgi:hypothetical protein